MLGAKSSVDTLAAENALAIAESALDSAKSNYEKRKVNIDRAIGDTLGDERLHRRRKIRHRHPRPITRPQPVTCNP